MLLCWRKKGGDARRLPTGGTDVYQAKTERGDVPEYAVSESILLQSKQITAYN